jgi:hypothetical protein
MIIMPYARGWALLQLTGVRILLAPHSHKSRTLAVPSGYPGDTQPAWPVGTLLLIGGFRTTDLPGWDYSGGY